MSVYDIDIDQVTGLAKKGRGGTELMYERIINRIPEDLKEKFQIVASRIITKVPEKKLILWTHDTWDDPQSQKLKDPTFRELVDKFVFVSRYQFESFHHTLRIPYSESTIIRNGIVPIPDHNKPTDKINLIYHTTPHRGLDVLLSAFNQVHKAHSDIHLNVYSSFKAYGWEHKDEPFKTLFDFCDQHPAITNHGFQSNETIRDALQQTHIFAYPSTWPETSCLAAIEAMSAGCLVVASDYGALSETIGDHGILYRFDEDKDNHFKTFTQVLNKAIVNYKNGAFEDSLKSTTHYANQNFNIETIAQQWIEFLRGV